MATELRSWLPSKRAKPPGSADGLLRTREEKLSEPGMMPFRICTEKQFWGKRLVLHTPACGRAPGPHARQRP